MRRRRTLSETVADDGPVEERMLTIGETSRLLGCGGRQVLALGEDGALVVRDGRVVASSAERLAAKGLPRMAEVHTHEADVRIEER